MARRPALRLVSILILFHAPPLTNSRYSWFGAMRNSALLYGVTPENKLLNEAGQLTPLGWQYIGGGHK